MNPKDTQQVVVFSLGGEAYALPIAAVSEIIRHTAPRTVVSHDPHTHGVIALRGKIVAVYDLAARLGLTPGEPAKIIIIDTDGHQIGVTVDDVDEVLTLTDDQLEPAPGADPDVVQAIAKVGDRLIVLLEPAGLFAAAEPVAA